jgi:hypothetical protein
MDNPEYLVVRNKRVRNQRQIRRERSSGGEAARLQRWALEVLATALPPPSAELLRLRFGIGGARHSVGDLVRRWKTTAAAVRCMETTALRALRRGAMQAQLTNYGWRDPTAARGPARRRSPDRRRIDTTAIVARRQTP